MVGILGVVVGLTQLPGHAHLPPYTAPRAAGLLMSMNARLLEGAGRDPAPPPHARDSLRRSRSGSSILKEGVGPVVNPQSPRLSFADQLGGELEDVSTIPARGQKYVSLSSDGDDRGGTGSCTRNRMLALLILVGVVLLVAIIGWSTSGSSGDNKPGSTPPTPPPKHSGSAGGNSMYDVDEHW